MCEPEGCSWCRCGFAQRQAPYEQAFHELFASLDRVEGILSTQRYLTGNSLTEADVRLFMTLIRSGLLLSLHA